MTDIPWMEESDLRIEPWPPHQQGGQHAGGMLTGVWVEHLPSGIVAIVNIGLSQQKNKEIAMDMILSALTHKNYR